jgi:hypothetical protein
MYLVICMFSGSNCSKDFGPNGSRWEKMHNIKTGNNL